MKCLEVNMDVLDNLFMIYAKSKNGVIGYNFFELSGSQRVTLPWSNQKEDLKFFTSYVNGTIGICGRHTYDSIPKNVLREYFSNVFILSSTMHKDDLRLPYNKIFRNIIEVDKYIGENPQIDFVVIGGKKVYEAFLPKVNTVVETEFNFEVDENIAGDVIFSPYLNNFEKVNEQHIKNLDGRINYYRNERNYV